MQEDEQLSADAMLINQGALSNAIKSAADDAPGGELIFVENEPLLSAYCRAELLQTLGKLAVSGLLRKSYAASGRTFTA